VFDRDDQTWQAVNARTGLFAATGPTFTSGTVEDLSILDLAPTLLHLHGREIPSNMDGDVRTDLFAGDSRPSERSPSYGPPRQEQTRRQVDTTGDDIRERLKDLGYI